MGRSVETWGRFWEDFGLEMIIVPGKSTLEGDDEVHGQGLGTVRMDQGTFQNEYGYACYLVMFLS